MRFRILAVTTALASVSFSTLAASATLVGYNNRTTFQAAAGPVTTTDFNSYSADTTFRNVSLDAGPFSLITSGPQTAQSIYNLIDAVPLSTSETDVNGTAHANVFTAAGGSFLITLDTASTAFGADFRNFNDGFLRTQIYVDGQLLSFSGQSFAGGASFLGFTSDTAFTTIEFRGIANDVFGIDNVSLRSPAAVPEPGTWALMLLGFGAIGASMRRRRRVTAVSQLA